MPRSQGSSVQAGLATFATLGFEAESLWDSGFEKVHGFKEREFLSEKSLPEESVFEKATVHWSHVALLWSLDSVNERTTKRQRTAALQDAVATDRTLLLPRGLGVRLSSAAFVVGIHGHSFVHWPVRFGIAGLTP